MKKILLIIVVFLAVAGGGYFWHSGFGDGANVGDVGSTMYVAEAGETPDPENQKKYETIPYGDGQLKREDLKCEGCNLIIISLTNTRKDHIGIYGYERNTTPNIDAFFQNSLIFDNAFAPASWTLPVIASFFSSQFPFTHGVMDRYSSASNKLADDILTMPEIFKENGYKTAAFTGGGDHNAGFGIGQGFDSYDTFDSKSGPALIGGPSEYKKLEDSMPSSLEWLKENSKDKFFLMLQGYDTHCPFTPKAPFDKKFTGGYESSIDYSVCLWTFEQTEPVNENGEKYWPLKSWYSSKGIQDIKMTDKDVEHMIALYDGEIAQADDYLKDFFQTAKDLDLEKNTIFIFMSEHGDLFGEHGRFMRGGPLRGTFYDPVLNFPLIVKHPKIKEPLRINSLVQTVDLMPTLLEIFGLEDGQKEDREGQSVLPEIVGERTVNDYVYAGSRFTAQKGNLFFSGTSISEAIRSKEWKLIKEEIFDADTNKKTHESYELYKISEDPKEENNLYDTNGEMANKLKTVLENFFSSF